MPLHQCFPQSYLPFFSSTTKMPVLHTLLCHSAFYRGREIEEIVTILQLSLQYSKHVQGERLSNDNSTDAAAACTSHPFFQPVLTQPVGLTSKKNPN